MTHTQNATPSNELIALFENGPDGRPVIDSRVVAEKFEKRHADVLRAIDDLISQAPEAQRNFAHGYYTLPNTGEQRHRLYRMNRDGFSLLAMGFTGLEAITWKLKFIAAFNLMEDQLRQRQLPALLDISTHEGAISAAEFHARATIAEAARVRQLLADKARLIEDNINLQSVNTSLIAATEAQRDAIDAMDAFFDGFIIDTAVAVILTQGLVTGKWPCEGMYFKYTREDIKQFMVAVGWINEGNKVLIGNHEALFRCFVSDIQLNERLNHVYPNVSYNFMINMRGIREILPLAIAKFKNHLEPYDYKPLISRQGRAQTPIDWDTFHWRS